MYNLKIYFLNTEENAAAFQELLGKTLKWVYWYCSCHYSFYLHFAFSYDQVSGRSLHSGEKVLDDAHNTRNFALVIEESDSVGSAVNICYKKLLTPEEVIISDLQICKEYHISVL